MRRSDRFGGAFARVVAACAWLLVLVTSVPSMAAAEDSLGAEERRVVEEGVTTFERYAFRDGQAHVGKVLDRRNHPFISYGAIGYIGSWQGFSELFFSTISVEIYPASLLKFRFGIDFYKPDVAILFSDRPGELYFPFVLRVLGYPEKSAHTFTREKLFDGACYLYSIQVEGGGEHTIAVADIAASEPSSNNKKKIEAPACLAAAMFYHVGLENVVKISSDELVYAPQINGGVRGIAYEPLASVEYLYNAKIESGMSREQAKNAVRGYIIHKMKTFADWEKKNGR